MVEPAITPARPDRPSFADAMALVRAHCDLLPAMAVRLSDSLGRVTAEPAYAAADYPLYDVAAMDGFALAAGDTAAASPRAPVVLSLALPAFA
ncbi:MAG TPA: hypothetical protein VF485_11485, partial [Sphingomonas sp.]